jgi:hypothetical protein
VLNKHDGTATLEIVTLYNQENDTHKHALIYRLSPTYRTSTPEVMQALVDAHSGILYSFVDTVHYLTARW